MRQVRLKDIAKKSGVSITTVSKVLNGSDEIGEATKQKVLRTAKFLNYKPNQIAPNLRIQQTKTIGVIVPSASHYFLSEVIKGIIERAQQEQYMVIFLQSNDKLSLEKRQVDLLIDKRVDGILISLSDVTKEVVHLKKVLSKNIPLVLFDKTEQSIPCSKVRIDDFEASYRAVFYFISRGYRKIAHFRGDFNPKDSNNRFEGYRQALIDNNIEFDESLVFRCFSNLGFQDGYNTAEKAINERPDIDAIFTSTDLAAIGVIKYFREKRIRMPEDVAVFGFSNWFMTTAVSPTLSTINQPAYEMGLTAMEVLLEEIKCVKNKQPIVFKEIILSTELVLRDSSYDKYKN